MPARSALRFFVGARFVCTKCRTRGVTPMCGCGARGTALDILAPHNARFFSELTSPPKSEGAPSRHDLFWDGLKSRPQWALSAGAAVVIGIMGALGETDWRWQTVGRAILEVLLLTLLFRLPVLALELMFRLLVGVAELWLALLLFCAGKVVGSARLVTAAGDWLARAVGVLNGDYFWRRSMVSLRAPASRDDAKQGGALPPSQSLRLLVTTGKHGALELSDGELPPFRVVLSSGETITVVVDAGVISISGRQPETSAERAISPLFQQTRQIDVGGAGQVTLVGGEWSEIEDGAGYRDKLTPRRLCGTPGCPLEIEIAEYGAVVSDEAAALTPGRPPRSSP